MAEYLTGAVRFNGDHLAEVVIYPIDPDPELEALGHMQMDYLVDAQEVIKGIKKGDVYHASFTGTGKLYRLEIISRDGKEALEIADVGQPDEFKTLRNLPEPG